MSGYPEWLLGCDCSRTLVLPGSYRLRRSQPREGLVRATVPGDYECFTRTRNSKPLLTNKGNRTASKRFCDPCVGYGVDHTRRVAGV
jgi:hypothetical protein